MKTSKIRAPPWRGIYIIALVVASGKLERPITVGIELTLGGSGGNTCMSESAQDQVREYMQAYDVFDGAKREMMIRENQMITRAMALQLESLIPLYTDPEWVHEAVIGVETESLRLKGTDER